MARLSLKREREYGEIVVGIDEAGVGPWAGPVVAAAVFFEPTFSQRLLPKGINDSKQLKRAHRDELFEEIHQKAKVGVGIASVEEIGSLNILRATQLAMLRSFQELNIEPHMAIVDGNRKPPLPCPAVAIVKGDEKYVSIAAASIVAKVTRDRIMMQLAENYPGYGWERNAGYGTKEHQDGLKKLGVTPAHRRSYAPIRIILEERKFA